LGVGLDAFSERGSDDDRTHKGKRREEDFGERHDVRIKGFGNRLELSNGNAGRVHRYMDYLTFVPASTGKDPFQSNKN